MYLLDYDLRFDESVACALFAPFMSSASNQVQARASAIDKVARAGRARAQAQQAQSQVEPSSAHSSQLQAASRPSSSVSLTVRSIVKKFSATHLSSSRDPPLTIHGTLSNGSASSSSSASDMASLLDDTGSSSSSSGWASNDSNSDCSEDENVHDARDQVDADGADITVTMTALPQALALSKATLGNKKSRKPDAIPPACAHKNVHYAQRRARKVSDSSSINTITASPPMSPAPTSSSTSFLFPLRGNSTHQRLFRRDSKRTTSLLATPEAARKDGITDGLTEPSIPRSVSASMAPSNTGNFLSRMWVAATVGKAQPGSEQNADQPPVPGALRRLVLAHSRSSVFNRSNFGQASRTLEV